MIGPAGVGKKEIARCLAKLANSPFLKVEASKFTEVGYVGRDVESMVRDLVEIAIDNIRAEKLEDVSDKAELNAEERLLDILLPPAAPSHPEPGFTLEASTGDSYSRTREKLRQHLREGMQRDILPSVEGTTVNTRYGMVRTDHILFIAAGAFHVSKPSDLIPELQGRFPIRVELQSLTMDDFIRILTEPKSSLVKQYTALLETEGVKLEFTKDALEEIARFAFRVNEGTENIGARQVHTIMGLVLDQISFSAPEKKGGQFKVDAEHGGQTLADIVKDQDLRRYILQAPPLPSRRSALLPQ